MLTCCLRRRAENPRRCVSVSASAGSSPAVEAGLWRSTCSVDADMECRRWKLLQCAPDANITQMSLCCSKTTVTTYGNCCRMNLLAQEFGGGVRGADFNIEVSYRRCPERAPATASSTKHQLCERGATR